MDTIVDDRLDHLSAWYRYDWSSYGKFRNRVFSLHVPDTIHVWYIYLHLPWKSTKCRQIYHTWMVWVTSIFGCLSMNHNLMWFSDFPVKITSNRCIGSNSGHCFTNFNQHPIKSSRNPVLSHSLSLFFAHLCKRIWHEFGLDTLKVICTPHRFHVLYGIFTKIYLIFIGSMEVKVNTTSPMDSMGPDPPRKSKQLEPHHLTLTP